MPTPSLFLHQVWAYFLLLHYNYWLSIRRVVFYRHWLNIANAAFASVLSWGSLMNMIGTYHRNQYDLLTIAFFAGFPVIMLFSIAFCVGR